MKIAVCIKQVPETNKVNIDPETGVLLRSGTASKMNPYDLYAIETAMRIKKENNAEITVITMGPEQAKEIIKEAYSLGVDEGYILSDRKFAGSDVLATAFTLSQGLKKAGEFDIIICGKQTTDGDTAQVGPEISEYLGIPCIAGVVGIISIGKSSLIVNMDMGNYTEKAEINYPCLICVDKDIYQPRLPSYRLKKATENKKINIITLEDMEDKDEKKYGLAGSPTKVRRIFPPDNNENREIWTGTAADLADKIADKLRELKLLEDNRNG